MADIQKFLQSSAQLNEGSTHTLIMAYVINFVACKSYIITKHVRKTCSKKNTYVIKLGTIMK